MSKIFVTEIPVDWEDALRILRKVPTSSFVSQGIYERALQMVENRIRLLQDETKLLQNQPKTEWTE